MKAIDTLRRLRNRLGPLWWHSLLMFIAARAGDLVALCVGLFIVPDMVSREKLGAVLPLVKLAAFVAVPLTVVGHVAMKYINLFVVRKEDGKVKALLRDLLVLNTVLSLVVVLSLWLCWERIRAGLGIEDDTILWLLAGFVLVSCWTPIVIMISRGLKRFYRITAARIVGPVARLVVVLLLIRRLQVAGYLAGSLAQPIAVLVLLTGGLRRFIRPEVRYEGYRDSMGEMLRYLWPIGIMTVVTAFQLAIEPWLIRQHFSADESAGYYMAAMLGNVPMWVAPAMVPFLFPLVSEQFERGESTRRMHVQSLVVVCAIGFSISLVFLFVGRHILQFRGSWRQFSGYAALVPQLALVATLDVLMRCHMMHESACRRFGFLGYLVPVVVAEVCLLLCLLRPGATGISTAGVVGVMLVSRVAFGLGIGVQVVLSRRGRE